MTYDNRKYSETMPPGYGLRDFVTFLVDLANDGVLNKKGEQRLTAFERARLTGHSQLLSGAVEELARILTSGYPPAVQDHRLDQFWQALGSAAVIASYTARNPMAARRDLERNTRGGVTRKTRSQRRDDITIEVARSIWNKLRGCTEWEIVDKVLRPLDERLHAAELRPLQRDTVARHLGRLKDRILA